MSNLSNHQSEEARARQHITEGQADWTRNEVRAPSPLGVGPAIARRLVFNRAAGASANTPARIASTQALQQTHGNRAVQRFVQRQVALTPVQRDEPAPEEAEEETAPAPAAGSHEEALGLLDAVGATLTVAGSHLIGEPSKVMIGASLSQLGVAQNFLDMVYGYDKAPKSAVAAFSNNIAISEAQLQAHLGDLKPIPEIQGLIQFMSTESVQGVKGGFPATGPAGKPRPGGGGGASTTPGRPITPEL